MSRFFRKSNNVSLNLKHFNNYDYLSWKEKQINKTSLLDPLLQIGNKPANAILLSVKYGTM